MPAPVRNGADPLEKKKLLKSWESSGGQSKKIKPGTGKFNKAKRKAEEIGPDEAGHNPSVCTGLLRGLSARSGQQTPLWIPRHISEQKSWSQRNGNFLTTKIQTLSFCFCKKRSKWAFVRRFFFLKMRRVWVLLNSYLTCYSLQTEVETRRGEMSGKCGKGDKSPT